ncbi:MAG TPA: hypothetical protein VK278_08700 [Gaiellaceae bacterium]|nr:hypothetical protein [Gaiellaceae bacterium]
MTPSYAVKWREPDGHVFLGKLQFERQALVLEGRNGGEGTVRRTIDLAELRSFRLGQSADERLDGQPTLVVERPGGDVFVTSSVVHAGVLQELADRLSELRLLAPRRATVVVPFKQGSVERVRRLAAAGPPFDPADLLLTRHQVLVTEQEAIFVFEAESELALDALLGRLDFSAAAAAWGDVVAGPPRLAEVVYAWERPVEPRAAGLGF